MNGIQKYFRYRQGLIDQYVKGDMSKREYLQANYDAVIYNDIKPFKNIDTIEKGLYNYQYYNALAKQMKFISTEYHTDLEMKNDYIEKSNYYYYKKDKATISVLKLIHFKGITSYFVKVKSKLLKGKLIEMVIEDNDMILHSTNTTILNLLREEGVFEEESKESLIDEYVNQKY